MSLCFFFFFNTKLMRNKMHSSKHAQKERIRIYYQTIVMILYLGFHWHTHTLINCCKKNLRVPVRDNISKKIQDIVQECGKKNTLAGYYTLRQNISLEDYFTVQDSSCVLRVCYVLCVCEGNQVEATDILRDE
ncbi:hypothetical protein RFI_37551, partial [Reticulomyxa filosa]